VGLLIIPQEPSELFVKGNKNSMQIVEQVMLIGDGLSLSYIYNKLFKGIHR
jgi:hypothetical protein